MNRRSKTMRPSATLARSYPVIRLSMAGPMLALLIGLLVHSVVQAQVPDNFSYQGYLTDNSGQPVDQPVTVELSLYTVGTGGNALWSEVQAITPVEGVFTATLGQDPLNLFPANLFDSQLYLGITVNSDTEMVPRTELTTAPFSHKARDAETVDGFSASQLDQSSAVAGLTTDVSTLEGDVTQLQTDLTTVENTLPTLQLGIPILRQRFLDSTDFFRRHGDLRNRR